MAGRDDLDFSYSLIDRIFRLSLRELADFSGAKYDGDFSLRLEQAQRPKHEYVAAQIGIGPRKRILDLGAFERNMIPLEEVDIEAPRDSDAWYLALMARQFPGSFLPWGREQVIDCAGRRF